jgi:hypothetical protein
MDDDTVWSDVSMMVASNLARAAATVLAMVVALLIGCGVAVAAPPEVAIVAPADGSATNVAIPTFTGSSDDPLDALTLNIYAGSSAGGTPVQALAPIVPLKLGLEEASWSALPAPLADGRYTAVAEQTNVEAETGDSAPVTFTVDTTPPEVSIDALPSPTKDSTPTLSGAAGTGLGDDGTVAVTIHEGATVGGKTVAGANASVAEGAWVFTPSSALKDGVYTVQASQEDEAGNVGVSAAMTFTVDTTAPEVSIDAVATPTKDSTPTLSGGAGAEAGDAASVTVTVHKGSLGGAVVAAGGPVVSGGGWSFTPSALPDGTYVAQVSQQDAAGNVGDGGPVTFRVDTTAPAVTTKQLTSPTKDRTPTLTGGRGTAAGDRAAVTVTVHEGSSPAGATVASGAAVGAGSSWSFAVSAELREGTYTVQASQEDEAGNVGTSPAMTFTVDTSGPAVSINQPTSPTNDSTPTLTGGAGTAAGDHAAVTVTIFQGSSASGKVAASGAATVTGPRWSFTSAHLANGVYTAQASQEDSLGNTATTAGVKFKVDGDAPVVTMTSPGNGTTTSGTSQTVGGAAGFAEGDQATVTIRLYTGAAVAGSPVQTISTQRSGGSWSATFGGLGAATYTAQAEQGDDAGNFARSEPVTFTIVPNPVPATPPPPTASFRWFPPAPRTGEPVSLVSTSVDPSSAIAAYAWAVAGNGAFAPGEAAIATSFAAPGPHVVQLRVTAADGQSGVVAETIPVTSAVVPLMQPFPVVRIAGSYNAAGAKLSLLTVLAPAGATVTVTCKGRSCPIKSQHMVAAVKTKARAGTVLIAFHRFERPLRAGTVLSVWVSNHGQIGKFTRFLIRHSKPPSRTDLCLNPAGTQPIVCPTS